MDFKDNFSKILLVSEQNVIFYSDDNYLKRNVDFSMKIVKIKDILTHPYIQHTIFLFGLTSSDIQKKFKLENKSSLWELIQAIGFNHHSFIIRSLQFYFSFVFGEAFVVNRDGWFLNDIKIDQKFFERVREITLVAAGSKKFEDQISLQNGKPDWLIEKEEEIKRIKNQKNNAAISNANAAFEDLMKILLPINYELNYTFEQLFDMNYFHIQFLSKYIPKIVGYDIQKRQIMSKKKIKYITEK